MRAASAKVKTVKMGIEMPTSNTVSPSARFSPVSWEGDWTQRFGRSYSEMLNIQKH
jgi:hypothetical protein